MNKLERKIASVIKKLINKWQSEVKTEKMAPTSDFNFGPVFHYFFVPYYFRLLINFFTEEGLLMAKFVKSDSELI